MFWKTIALEPSSLLDGNLGLRQVVAAQSYLAIPHKILLIGRKAVVASPAPFVVAQVLLEHLAKSLALVLPSPGNNMLTPFLNGQTLRLSHWNDG